MFSDDQAVSAVIQNDGKIILGGFTNNSIDDDFALVRFNSDGSLDNTFGTSGIVITQIGSSDERIHSLLLQDDGKDHCRRIY